METSMKESRLRNILGGIIPELVWRTLEADLFELIIDSLKCLDKEVIEQDIMDFIEQKKYRIGTLEQSRSGAGWTIRGNITIRPDDVRRCHEPYVLSLILHEIYHVKRQSVLMRLSMKGELDAWKYQYRIYPLLKPGHEIGEVYGNKGEEWQKLCRLSGDSREDLEEAREHMVNIAPGYRAYALPIHPLPQEIGYYLRRGDFKGVIEMLQNLAKGAKGERVGKDSQRASQ